MIKNKKVIIGFFILMLTLLWGNVFATTGKYAGNETKTEMENLGWKDVIEAWDAKFKLWDVERKSAHLTDFENHDREYCSERGCWSEDMMDISFVGKNSSEKWTLDKSDSDADVIDKKGNSWTNINSGQVLTYAGVDGELWESSNTGQVIEYKNTRGDRWESSNTGQVIIYESVDGEQWESANDGQTINYKNIQGDSWEGDDSSIEYISADGEKWDSGDTDNEF